MLFMSHPIAICVSAVELLCFSLALHHRVRRFKMGRVGHQWQSNIPVSHTIYPPVVHAQVVLDISWTLQRYRHISSIVVDLIFVLMIKFTRIQKSAHRQNVTDLIGSFKFRVKLTEDLLQLLADHIGKHVQTPSTETDRKRERVCHWYQESA